MRIGVNALFLIPGEVGGSETYLVETLRAMLHEDPDLQVVLFTNDECDLYLWDIFSRNPRVCFDHIRLRASNRYARIIVEQVVLPRHARRSRLDVLWSPGYTSPLWCRVPQVVSILDMQYRSHPEDLSPVARGATHFLVNGSARRARKILAISRFSRQEIVRHTSAPEERIDVTPLGVDPLWGQPGNPDAERALRSRHIGDADPYILCVSNSYPHKNLHTLVRAFSLIAPRIPHRLVLVGKPRRGESRLRDEIKNAPASRITRLDRLERDELIALTRGADVFVFPSLYEGFGLPVLEAMRAGVPVVTTRAGSLPEVGGDGVVYAEGRDPSDLARGIQEVLGWGAGARSAWIARAGQHAAQFTWESTAQATLRGLKAARDAKSGPKGGKPAASQ